MTEIALKFSVLTGAFAPGTAEAVNIQKVP